jgi:hypothetical protein
MNTTRLLLAAASGTTLALGGLVASPALAAQQVQPLQCDGHQITVRVNEDNSSDHGGWSAAVVIDGGSGVLVPTSFSGSAYDDTAGQEIFSFAESKGNGNGNHNQQTISCSDTTVGTLGSLLEPGDEVPPGMSADDIVEFTINVTAVVRS